MHEVRRLGGNLGQQERMEGLQRKKKKKIHRTCDITEKKRDERGRRTGV